MIEKNGASLENKVCFTISFISSHFKSICDTTRLKSITGDKKSLWRVLFIKMQICQPFPVHAHKGN